MAVNESYTEESFIRQIKESGAVSFRDMPCPVHNSIKISKEGDDE